jgi:hypothetical protein
MGKLEETIAVTAGIGLAAARFFLRGAVPSLCKPLRRISIEPL